MGIATPHEPQQKCEESRGTKKFADAACIFFFFCFIILYVPGACEIFTASAHVSLLLFVCIPSPHPSTQVPFPLPSSENTLLDKTYIIEKLLPAF